MVIELGNSLKPELPLAIAWLKRWKRGWAYGCKRELVVARAVYRERNTGYFRPRDSAEEGKAP